MAPGVLDFTEPGFLGGVWGGTVWILPPGPGSSEEGEPGWEVERRGGERKLPCFPTVC